jgi:hypothetical protein
MVRSHTHIMDRLKRRKRDEETVRNISSSSTFFYSPYYCIKLLAPQLRRF